MTVPKRQRQVLAVALYIANKAEELGKQWQTDNDRLAMTIAEILAKMVNYETPAEIKGHIDAMIETGDEIGLPDVKSWTYICLVINWLSWAWNEQGESELAKAWSEAWYRIDEYSRDNLSKKTLSYYLEQTD